MVLTRSQTIVLRLSYCVMDTTFLKAVKARMEIILQMNETSIR